MGRWTDHSLGRRRFLGLSGAAVAISQVPWLLFDKTDADATTIVYASSYGWNSTDNTTALQNALDSGADVVVIDLVNGQQTTTWLTGPLFVNNDNFTIIVQSGVTVQAVTSLFPNSSDCLLSIVRHTGITLYGYGGTLAMTKSEFPSNSQFHAALEVSSSQQVHIEGLTLQGAAGDGLNIRPDPGPAHLDYPQYCIDVTVKNVTCDGNNRNGMSVLSVDGLTVQGCKFNNSKGTSPEAGVDFEPASLTTFPNQRITNVTFTDSLVQGNHQDGLDIPLNGLSNSPTPVSISFARLTISSNGGKAGFVVTGGYPDPGGSVTMSDSLIYSDGNGGCVRVNRKSATGMAVAFDDMVNWDEYSAASQFSTIIASPVPSPSNLTNPVPGYGGVTWTDCSVISNQAPPFLATFDDSYAPQGLSGLDGNITVADPAGVSMDLGANPHDNTLAVTALAQAPSTTVGVTISPTSTTVGGGATFTFSRTGDTTAPLAIAYTVALTGSALINGMPGCAVIPAGQTVVHVPMNSVRAAYSSGIPTGSGAGKATITISPADFSYTIGSNKARTLTIS